MFNGVGYALITKYQITTLIMSHLAICDVAQTWQYAPTANSLSQMLAKIAVCSQRLSFFKMAMTMMRFPPSY